MKTRMKLLFAGLILTVTAWRPAPAVAACHILPFFCDSEEECEQACYGNGCYSYYFDGLSCICS